MTHCNNIKEFSKNVYDFLTRVFSYNLNFSELGITDHLVFSIVQNSHLYRLQNVEIYKMPWTIESVYGNDLDLFIEDRSGNFNYYALQAKVMSANGAFMDIKFKNTPIQQWNKLLQHEADFGSKTYYLLYCGQSRRPPNAYPTREDCIGIPTLKEYGTSIVETHVIKDIREVQLTTYANLYFRNVFPDNVDSLRKLFCCVDDLPKTNRQFKREEISTDGYQKIYLSENPSEDYPEDYSEDYPEKYIIKEGNAPLRIIISLPKE